MQSVSTINKSKLYFLSIFLIVSFLGNAQENSPFSRYGLGDLVPSQNIVNRAMGGFNSTYSSLQSVNFSNPASYSHFVFVNYDIGITLDSRSLRSANPVQKYNSVNLTPSYVALGVPLSSPFKKNRVGLAFGLMPLTKVNYNINDRKIINNGKDSILSLYEGDGGLYQGFVGIAKNWGGLSLGINTGLLFGRKDIVTRTIVVDTFLTYKSNSSDNTSFNHLYLNFGLQYEDTIRKSTTIKFGFSGNMKQKLSANKIINRETYTYDLNDNPITIDSIYNSGNQSGTITLPASYTAGVSIGQIGNDKGASYQKSMIGIEYTTSKWSQFRNFGEPDRLVNSWQTRIGGQITPKVLSGKSYWSLVTYRAGFYFGKEAVNADGNDLPIYGITIGAGLPIINKNRYWGNSESTVLNTTFEIGKRGNSKNNITESFFRFAVSVNLSDRWFIKRKYD